MKSSIFTREPNKLVNIIIMHLQLCNMYNVHCLYFYLCFVELKIVVIDNGNKIHNTLRFENCNNILKEFKI